LEEEPASSFEIFDVSRDVSDHFLSLSPSLSLYLSLSISLSRARTFFRILSHFLLSRQKNVAFSQSASQQIGHSAQTRLMTLQMPASIQSIP